MTGAPPRRLSSAAVPADPAVYLARHGQTAYNLQRRFQGLLPVPLDDTGRTQAAELAEAAAAHPFAVLWCSPLARARETADIVAQRIGLTPVEDARLVETDAGDWTDRPFADVQAEDPEGFAAFVTGDPQFRFPGGESFAEQATRVAAALDDVERGRLPALVVCHGQVIRLTMAARHPGGLDGALRGSHTVANGALIPLPPA
jgi:broad specificity phosphatase PhoE